MGLRRWVKKRGGERGWIARRSGVDSVTRDGHGGCAEGRQGIGGKTLVARWRRWWWFPASICPNSLYSAFCHEEKLMKGAARSAISFSRRHLCRQ